ncbi:hypothetical protein BHYA_0118g00220 [Botrytis hyacinthi]|uniref:SnoaL-like domain-containing protein n=1 Tax=Botrytis hyacinthi TaxID=278943 RepID=A0A4Z1GSW5_9HELO|nr:hypothetical protein BHYA_0118g00220 [Botrytis hyacinthi]
MAYNITEKETQPVVYNHFNGTHDEILACFCISELYKGWPLYRDASEWTNHRSMFTKKGAKIWTSWSGGKAIDDFIGVSKEGRKNGDFIMHRENGTLVDLNLPLGRAIGKMKATITQRFVIEDTPIDVECDCRFIIWCLIEDGEWEVKYSQKYPEGYRYLAVAQHKIGHPILEDLPTMMGRPFGKMYEAMAAWLRSEDVDLNWD